VVLLPNGFTLSNLLCGVYALVLASRHDYRGACTFVVLGGIADALDGRVARATGTGSRFGEELDSLVDALSFGLAPAMIMYFAVLSQTNWQWLFVFFYVACAVMRLARFNVEQAGRSKTHFHGLPSPAAGVTLASYYWFAQTPLYNQTIILFSNSKTISDLPWNAILPGLMAVLAILMISDVPYPAVPQIGIRTWQRIFGTLVVVGAILGLIFLRREFFFPALLAYVLFGALKWGVLGFLGRSSTPAEIYLSESGDDAYEEPEPRHAPAHRRVAPSRAESELTREEEGEARPRRRRRRRGGRGPSGSAPPGSPPAPPSPSSPPPSNNS
jgi:CDP-diacylglycerol--serine O-phosphatidyltransferase